jgi:hypothetical protein
MSACLSDRSNLAQGNRAGSVGQKTGDDRGIDGEKKDGALERIK